MLYVIGGNLAQASHYIRRKHLEVLSTDTPWYCRGPLPKPTP
jgi:hypothetical protein